MTKENDNGENKKPYLGLKAFLILNQIEENEIAKILCINIKRLNEKLNGYYEFTYEEVSMLCDIYNISSDIFSKNTKFRIYKIRE